VNEYFYAKYKSIMHKMQNISHPMSLLSTHKYIIQIIMKSNKQNKFKNMTFNNEFSQSLHCSTLSLHQWSHIVRKRKDRPKKKTYYRQQN